MSNYYNTVNKNPIVIKTIKPTLGLEKTKEFKKKLEDKKKGRKTLKGGSDFPDYSGDGKTTMKDILMARGVIPKPKDKKKKMVAKKFKTPMDKSVKKDKNKKRFV